jgi:O-antigen/teichoic acid export membrane protein
MTARPASAPTSTTSVRRRIVYGLGSQGYGQAVQMLIRLAEVPLLLHFWGVQLYGEWLMLAAIPAYLAIGDGGFAGAASRDMSMRSGVGDRAGALAVFQSTGWLLCLMSLAVFTIAFAVVPFAPLRDWLEFEQMSAGELNFVLLVLVTHVLVGFQGGLINGGFWCSGRYPLGMALAVTTQLIEFAAMVAAVALGGGPVQAALAYLAGRIVGTALTRLALRHATPWLCYGLANASMAEIRRLAAPAFASLAFPLGNALNIQGMRLVVGMVLGPAAVAAFAALRTLTNFATQPRLIVNRLIEPELGVAFGADNQALFNRLFLRGCQVALWAGIAVALALLLAGPRVWPIWTQGQVALSWPLFLILLAAALVNSLWYTALMVPYATNRHGRIALIYAGVYGGGALALSYLGASTSGLAGAGAGLLVVEIGMACYVLPTALKMAGQHWGAWLSITLQPPTLLLSRAASATFHALRGKSAK